MNRYRHSVRPDGALPRGDVLCRLVAGMYVPDRRPADGITRTARIGQCLRIGHSMIVLGVILLIIGFLTGISILWTIGIVLLVIGLILLLLGSTGRKVGGRRHYF
jgi:Family of unknown function (DUF6131)